MRFLGRQNGPGDRSTRGLVWAGRPTLFTPEGTNLDDRRSIPLSALAPLAQVPGVSLVSLQTGLASAQATAPRLGMKLHDWTAELHDFANTAALIASLDLVISVDTAVVHLAAALGKPTWFLNRHDTCWRWLMGRDDSPRYPTLRQFRQPVPGDWATPIMAAVKEVRTLIAEGA